MKRLKLYPDKLKAIKDKSGMTYHELSKLAGKNTQNYTWSNTSKKSIEEPTAHIIATALKCKVEDFTTDDFTDHRIANQNAGRKRKASPVIVPESKIRVEGNHIYITPPFMETWQSLPKPQDEPNCVYYTDQYGIRGKIIEKQKVCTVMFLPEWKPIEDIRQAFRELREIL